MIYFVATYGCKKMPTRITNIATCITQVTMKLVHYALLINHLWFRLTFEEVLANFLHSQIRVGSWYGAKDFGLSTES